MIKLKGVKLFIIATSFGGITLNRYLIKEGKKEKDILIGGLIISTPFYLEGASVGIEGPITKHLLNIPICNDLKRRMQLYEDILIKCPWYSRQKMEKCVTVRDFDRLITSASYGFKSDEDYYAECSPVGKLHKIPLPLFALNAIDDPIQYGKYLPIAEAQDKNSNLAFVTTSRGGRIFGGIYPIYDESKSLDGKICTGFY